MKVRVKKLDESAYFEHLKYATAGSACFDIATNSAATTVAPGQSAVFDTGLAFEIPVGYVMKVYSRSGHGFKNGIRLANTTGIIDSDYRGELKIKLHNDGTAPMTFYAGDRIAQALIEPVRQVEFELADELVSTDRGTGGFGSTGV
jgi:dUTP pyrophosphatase